MPTRTATQTRILHLGSGSINIEVRADQPGPVLDAELRLLFRALRHPPLSPCVEIPSWDAGIAVAAKHVGWDLAGAMLTLNLGATESCEAGVPHGERWSVLHPHGLVPERFKSAVVRLPYWIGRAGWEWLLRTAATGLMPGGRLYLLGARNRGVESARGLAVGLVGPVVDQVIAERRRLYVFERRDTGPPGDKSLLPTNELLAGRLLIVHHHPLVFSPGRVDPATTTLAHYLPERGGRWLDLGCGSGVVAAVAAGLSGRNVTAVDWSYAAVAVAADTLQANGLSADVCLSDGVPSGAEPFEVVVCFPPFHVGPRVDHAPARQLIRTARTVLAPGGECRVVLTSAQSPRLLLEPVFRSVQLVAEAEGVSVFACHSD